MVATCITITMKVFGLEAGVQLARVDSEKRLKTHLEQALSDRNDDTPFHLKQVHVVILVQRRVTLNISLLTSGWVFLLNIDLDVS